MFYYRINFERNETRTRLIISFKTRSAEFRLKTIFPCVLPAPSHPAPSPPTIHTRPAGATWSSRDPRRGKVGGQEKGPPFRPKQTIIIYLQSPVRIILSVNENTPPPLGYNVSIRDICAPLLPRKPSINAFLKKTTYRPEKN